MKCDETWSTRFFTAAADISHAEMQQVWGKVLASEVAKLGSFSLRTLETLRNMSSTEAKIFQRFCSLTIGHPVVYKMGQVGNLEPFGVSFGDILELRGAGLVADSDMLTNRLPLPCFIPYHGEALLVRYIEEANVGPQLMEDYPLTSVGAELAQLISNPPNWPYVQALASYWKAKGCCMRVAYDFVLASNGSATWRYLEGIPPADQQAEWAPIGNEKYMSTHGTIVPP